MQITFDLRKLTWKTGWTDIVFKMFKNIHCHFYRNCQCQGRIHRKTYVCVCVSVWHRFFLCTTSENKNNFKFPLCFLTNLKKINFLSRMTCSIYKTLMRTCSYFIVCSKFSVSWNSEVQHIYLLKAERQKPVWDWPIRCIHTHSPKEGREAYSRYSFCLPSVRKH